MTLSKNRHFSGILLAIGGAILFSFKGIAFKLSFQHGASVAQILALRMIFALPVFLGVMMFVTLSRKQGATSPPLKPLDFFKAAGLGVISYYVCSYLDASGLNYISAQLERLIMFLYPTITALLMWVFYKEKITWRHGAALLLSYSGVTILFGRELEVQGSDVVLGSVLVFAATALFAAYVTATKPMIAKMGSLLFTSVAMTAASIVILIHFGIKISIEGIPLFNPFIIGIGAFLAIACTIAPAFMVSEAIARIGPGFTSAVGGIGPVSTAIAAVILLNEPFEGAHGFALIMTVFGILLLITSNPPSKSSV